METRSSARKSTTTWNSREETQYQALASIQTKKTARKRSTRRVWCDLEHTRCENGRKMSHFRITPSDKEQHTGAKRSQKGGQMMPSAENARRCARVCGGGHRVVMHTTKRSKSTEIAPRTLADAAKVREHRGEMHQLDERVGLDVW